MLIRRFALSIAACLFALGWALSPARSASFPPPIVPQNFGVNIHFTGAPPKDIDGLARVGVGWIRMDFLWSEIEKTRGVYDFSAYDTLVSALSAHHIHPLFILDYENPLYEAASPSTPEARAAFARFAAAAARHFAGKTILWEVWNEPNISFWKPAPNAHDYAALALATARAIKAADPKATVIAPGMSAMDFAFAETCFQAGLLKYIDAVSFHPYRSGAPETAAADYATLRGLIARYQPSGKEIALVSSEWGYSTAGVPEEQQAQYLTREWLSNLEQGIKVSIWYDWHDDGTNPKDGESNYGTVNYDYSPKAAFIAAQTLTHTLSGYRFVKRVVTKSDSDYLLIFAKGKSYKLAAWTTGTDHTIPVPFVGTATLTHMLGDSRSLASDSGILNLPISQSPVYVDVPPGNIAIALTASLTITPAHSAYLEGPVRCAVTFTNPLNKPTFVNVEYRTLGSPFPRGAFAAIPVKPHQTITKSYSGKFDARKTVIIEAQTIPLLFHVGPNKVYSGDESFYTASADFVSAEPMDMTVCPAPDGSYFAHIDNPSKTSFAGTLMGVGGGPKQRNVALTKGQSEADLWFGGTGKQSKSGVNFDLLDSQGVLVAGTPAQSFVPYTAKPAEWKAALDGDPKVQSKIELTAASAGAPLNAPAARLDYSFGTGWSFIRIFDPKAKPLSGKPAGETIWVKGDGSGNALRMRFQDSTGQTFQQDFGKCDWTGWRPVSCRFTGDNHWGGANDGIIHYPVKIDSILLLDSTTRDHKEGSIQICDPEIVFQD